MTTSILNRRVSLGRRHGGEPAAAAFAATHTLGVGRLTMGQAIPKGQVPSGSALAFAGLATQFDLKTTWPDGSARFAILSASVTSGGAYPLAVGTAAAGTFSPAVPAASVTLTISGTAYTATLPGSVSSDPWLAGPVVREWRHRVTPTTAGSAAHPFLRVYFDVRVYSAGGSRVDVTVENCQDAVASSAVVTYDASVSVAGSVAYTLTAQPHYYLTRWRKVFATGGLSESSVTLDVGPLSASGAVPPFLATCDSPSFDLTGANFAPMKRGSNFDDYMGATGGRPEIAPYPDWAAAYLVHQTANQRATTLINSDLAGSWPAHVRNADDSLVSIDARPDYWLDVRGGDKPAGDMTTGAGPLATDTGHVPSYSYIPYLLTGDRYHMEEMAFWGNWSLIVTWPATPAATDNFGDGRDHAVGIVGAAQVRGRGWCLRNLVDAAAYVPDAHPNRAYLAAKVAGNLSYYDTYAAGHSTPLGTVCEITSGLDATSVVLSLWQQAYLGWSIHHARRQGFATAAAVRDRAAAFQNLLFNSDPAWPIADACPYYPSVGTSDGADHYTFRTGLAACWSATYPNSPGNPGLDSHTPFVGYYGLEGRMHLLVAVANGLPGASAAMAYLMAQPGMAAYVNSRPGFAIDPADYP